MLYLLESTGAKGTNSFQKIQALISLADNERMPLKRTLAALSIAVAGFSQTPLVPPANVPYGISISPDTAKKIAAAAIAEARKNNGAMAVAIVDTERLPGVLRKNAGHSIRQCRGLDRQSKIGHPVPAPD